VVFLGDSITHPRKWRRHVTDACLTRFPDRQLHYFESRVDVQKSGPLGSRQNLIQQLTRHVQSSAANRDSFPADS
jgi:hypothetical protein